MKYDLRLNTRSMQPLRAPSASLSLSSSATQRSARLSPRRGVCLHCNLQSVRVGPTSPSFQGTRTSKFRIRDACADWKSLIRPHSMDEGDADAAYRLKEITFLGARGAWSIARCRINCTANCPLTQRVGCSTPTSESDATCKSGAADVARSQGGARASSCRTKTDHARYLRSPTSCS